MSSNKKTTWKDVKAVLSEKDKAELLKLIADLYSSSSENRSFIQSRYSVGGESLEPYRSIISESLYPDVYKDRPIRLSVGKKAIADYFKATKDKAGQLELMVHYLECGNEFTVEFGDMDERFYASLESMFDRILKALRTEPTDVQAPYITRLESVVSSARNIGWGYYDYISDIFEEFVAE
jgi:hypothetical protein